jgi:Cytochrome c554 and c-prime
MRRQRAKHVTQRLFFGNRRWFDIPFSPENRRMESAHRVARITASITDHLLDMSDSPQLDFPVPEPTSRKTPKRLVAVIGFLGIAVVVGLSWWLQPQGQLLRHVKPTTLAGTPAENLRFIGTKACRDCHPGAYAAHSASGHAKTLRPAGGIELAKKIDGLVADDPETPGVKWRYHRGEGTLVAERLEGQDRQRLPLDFALGSGQHAVTFVSLARDGVRPPSAEEHRLTYFAHTESMGLTPGQVREGNTRGLTSTGFLLPPAVVLDCFECHGTRTVVPRDGGLAPETLIPNVSCERCHGPGREHAELATHGTSNPAELSMPFGSGVERGDEQVAMCGHCHRVPSMVPAKSIRTGNAALARFPSIGLSQSRCFQQSRRTLSCTTCHDPHSRASNDTVAYETTCVSCHSGRGKKDSHASTISAAPCPVNPSSGCLPCHMPKRDVGFGLEFSDHWIRVPDKPRAAKTPMQKPR